MRRTVTLRDVAAAADVHPSTASRALNEGTRAMVNDDTVARVQRVATRLGYQPNALAQGLKVNRTMTIGMLIPDLTNPLFPPIVRGIEDRCSAAGYTLLIANTDNDEVKERQILDAMARRRIDGLVIATARRESALLTEVLASRQPVVLVNRTADEPGMPSVAGDDHAGVGLAVRHLVSLGHRRIAHLAGSPTVSTGLIRRQSFVSWMETSGIEADPNLIVNCTWFTQSAGEVAFEQLLDRDVRFTAVVAANDLIALGCLEVAKRRGIRIPHDVSIVGFNDIPFADKFSPPLITVRIPHYQIGVQAAELILTAIDAPGAGGLGVRLTPELVVRDSTTSPRTGELVLS